MRAHLLVATPVSGPLTADQLTFILEQFRSVHQFQQFDQFSVVFINEAHPLQLDRGAMESIVDYLGVAEPNCRKTLFLASLTNRLIVRPRPEPEVLASLPAPEAEPEQELAAKYVARVRFNLLNGRRSEETRLVNTLSELDHLLEEGPYDEDIKNIKIRLELRS